MGNKLIIFDFDGVIVETEFSTFSYYQALLNRDYNIALRDEDFRYKVGRKSVDFFKDVLGPKFNLDLVSQLVDKKRSDFQSDIRKYVTLMPGVRELLSALSEMDVTVALGSQNESEFILECLKEFSLTDYFAMIKGRQDIKKLKPDPEIFQSIAIAFDIAPSEAVVIEDSNDGLLAAKNGGFKRIAICQTDEQELLLSSLSDLCVRDIGVLTANQLLTF